MTTPSDPGQPLIRGEHLHLRPVTTADAGPRYLAWLNDPVVNRFLESRLGAHTPESLRDFVRAKAADPHCLFLAIVLNQGERHLGNLKLEPISRYHGTAEVGIMLGERDAWGRGYGSEALALVARHAFEVMGLRKLTAGCYANNLGSLKAFQRAGFAVEAVRPRHFLCEGQYVDWILMARFNPAWEQDR